MFFYFFFYTLGLRCVASGLRIRALISVNVGGRSLIFIFILFFVRVRQHYDRDERECATSHHSLHLLYCGLINIILATNNKRFIREWYKGRCTLFPFQGPHLWLMRSILLKKSHNIGPWVEREKWTANTCSLFHSSHTLIKWEEWRNRAWNTRSRSDGCQSLARSAPSMFC